MADIKKIYRVVDGVVASANVVKTTPKLVWIDVCLEFGYSCNFYKEHVCVTEQEAIQEEINKALSKVGSLKDMLGRAENRLADAEKLKTAFTVGGTPWPWA